MARARHRNGIARAPDVTWNDTQIWYGPGDTVDEIEAVTVVQPAFGEGEWRVTEYTFVGGYEMYEEGVREWISQETIVEARGHRDAFHKGIDHIAYWGGEEWEGTTDDLIEESVLPPRGMTWRQWGGRSNGRRGNGRKRKVTKRRPKRRRTVARVGTKRERSQRATLNAALRRDA